MKPSRGPGVPEKRRTAGFAALIGVPALCLMFLYRRFYAVGMINDDAGFIMGAKALLQGHFQYLSREGNIPITAPLPGFPLFLAPFVFLTDPHWEWLRFLPAALILGTAVLLWRLTEGDFPVPWRIGFICLFLWAPITNLYATHVMSEPLMLFLAALVFLLLKRFSQGKSPQGLSLAIGLLGGWAILVRPQAAAIVLSAAAGMVLIRHWKSAAVTLAVAAAMVLPVGLRNKALSGTGSEYLTYSSGFLSSALENPAGLLAHTLELLRQSALFTLVPRAALDRGAVIGLVAAVGWAVILWGAFSFFRRGHERRWVPYAAMIVYTGLLLAVHALWPVIDTRYFLPIVPILGLFFWCGARAISDRFGYKWGMPLVFSALLCSYGAYHVWMLTGGFLPSRNLVARQTYGWVAGHIPPSVKAADFQMGETFWLFTGRPVGMVGPDIQDLDHFRFRLEEAGISCVVSNGRPVLDSSVKRTRQKTAVYASLSRLMLETPQFFTLRYENQDEKTLVFKFVPSADHRAAYPVYLDALALLHGKQPAAARRRLGDALRMCADFPAALNALGMVSLIEGQGLKEGRRALEKAVALAPAYALARLNLGRVYRQMGQTQSAREQWEAALSVAQWDELAKPHRPAIEEALASLKG